MAHLLRLYGRVASAFSSLQSVMLLAVRLYWGFHFVQTGLGKIT
jgi:putative oxidoreductase